MTLVNQLFLLDRLDGVINRKATGNRKQLARKLRICMRSIDTYLEILRELGADIKYCRQYNSYIYGNSFRFQLKYLNGFETAKKQKKELFF